MEKMAIFVDGANCFYAQRDVLHWQIDWGRLLDLYRRDFDVVAAHFYRAVLSPQSEKDVVFGNFLRVKGFSIRQKAVKEIVDGETGQSKWKGNLDIELAIDAISTSSHYDVCLLISGDGDFAPLVTALRTLGKRVKVLSTRGIMAGELLDEVGLDYEDLENLRGELEYKLRATPEDPRAINGADPSSPAVWFVLGNPYISHVVSVSKKGAYVTTPLGIQAFLPVSRLGIQGFVANAATIIGIGEVFEVAVDRRSRNSDPTLLYVKLVDSDAQARLQKRFETQSAPLDDIPLSGEFELQVAAVKSYGAFLQNPWGVQVLLHIDSLGLDGECDDCSKLISKGDTVRIAVKGRSQGDGRAALDVELADPHFSTQLQQRLAKLKEAGADAGC